MGRSNRLAKLFLVFMKNSFFPVITLSMLLGATLMALFSFKATAPVAAPQQYQYMQFSTVESIVPGGLGRSRIIYTDEKGSAVEKEIKNFYSMTGINFSNIANNDKVIIERLNQFIGEGWELAEITTGVQSPSAGETGGGSGIFITRYLLRKPL
jgi:hypothetical protein